MSDNRILSRLRRARPDSGPRIPGLYVWCSSVIGVDGKWHMFSAAWPERVHPEEHDDVQFRPFGPELKAYTHTVEWIDGTRTTMDRRERPWLVLQDGAPTHLVTGVLKDRRARSVVQPLGIEG